MCTRNVVSGACAGTALGARLSTSWLSSLWAPDCCDPLGPMGMSVSLGAGAALEGPRPPPDTGVGTGQRRRRPRRGTPTGHPPVGRPFVSQYGDRILDALGEGVGALALAGSQRRPECDVHRGAGRPGG